MTAVLDALRIHVKGVGTFPIPDEGYGISFARSSEISIQFMDDYVLPDDVEFSLSSPGETNLHVGDPLHLAAVPVKVTARVTASGIQGEELSDKRTWSLVVTPNNVMASERGEFSDLILDWELVLDSRNQTYTLIDLDLALQATDGSWFDGDLSGLALPLHHSRIGAVGTNGDTTTNISPWRWPSGGGTDGFRVPIDDVWAGANGSVLEGGCTFRVERDRGFIRWIAILGQYQFVVDDMDAGVGIRVRDLGFGSIITIPDWSIPVLRISKDHPEGIALTEDEIKALDAERAAEHAEAAP
ncbi:MAG: hypothetical protein MK100_09530 [Phycisphaerales bacterium]|nr:hypothetical protein [Phycisphaerales bacterium]